MLCSAWFALCDACDFAQTCSAIYGQLYGTLDSLIANTCCRELSRTFCSVSIVFVCQSSAAWRPEDQDLVDTFLRNQGLFFQVRKELQALQFGA